VGESDVDVVAAGLSDGELVATAMAPPVTMATTARDPTTAIILREIMLFPPSSASFLHHQPTERMVRQRAEEC
jgi:hypothetical protein